MDEQRMVFILVTHIDHHVKKKFLKNGRNILFNMNEQCRVKLPFPVTNHGLLPSSSTDSSAPYITGINPFRFLTIIRRFEELKPVITGDSTEASSLLYLCAAFFCTGSSAAFWLILGAWMLSFVSRSLLSEVAATTWALCVGCWLCFGPLPSPVSSVFSLFCCCRFFVSSCAALP
jgi:hypothetical protein